MIATRRLGLRVVAASQFRQNAVKYSGLAEDNLQIINVRREGDNVDDNYSLLVDQVVNSKNAFRNARVSTVVNKLPAKVENGKLAVKNIDYFGKETVVEAGEGMSHDEFKTALELTRAYLSLGRDLFVEDLGIGASSSLRVGTRIISDNPAHAFIFRSILINIPPRVPNHLERFHGWNMENQEDCQFDRIWNGSTYEFVRSDASPKKGERPIVVYVGGDSNKIGVQFQQLRSNSAVIAGANVIAGGKSSIRGVIDALVSAGSALINSDCSHALAVPSLTVTKDNVTTLIVGNISDDLVAKSCSSGTLYGAYANAITSSGISALFNGVVVPTSVLPPETAFSGFTARESYPVVVSNEQAVRSVNPDNFTFKPSTVVFIGPETTLSLEDAITRLVQLCGDESKVDIARSLLSSAKIVSVNSEKDVLHYVV